MSILSVSVDASFLVLFSLRFLVSVSVPSLDLDSVSFIIPSIRLDDPLFTVDSFEVATCPLSDEFILSLECGSSLSRFNDISMSNLSDSEILEELSDPVTFSLEYPVFCSELLVLVSFVLVSVISVSRFLVSSDPIVSEDTILSFLVLSVPIVLVLSDSELLVISLFSVVDLVLSLSELSILDELTSFVSFSVELSVLVISFSEDSEDLLTVCLSEFSILSVICVLELEPSILTVLSCELSLECSEISEDMESVEFCELSDSFRILLS